MKLSDIVKILQTNIPKYTSLFNNFYSITSLSNSGGTVTAVTSAVHGLTTGDNVLIQGAKTPNPSLELTQSSGIGRLVTQFNHDVTRNTPLRIGDSTTITISGANESDYNGTFTIHQVTNSNVIEFIIDDAAPATATGSPQLDEDISIFYNGRYEVTVIDTTTFTYTITDTPTTNTASGTITVSAQPNISGCKHLDNAKDAYTAGGNWLFATITTNTVSKQRTGSTDALASFYSGQDLRQRLIQTIELYVFLPAVEDLTGTINIDIVEDLRPAVLSSFHQSKIDTGLNFGAARPVYVLDEQVQEDTDATRFIYAYQFQAETIISNADGVDPNYTKALKEFKTDTNNEFEEVIASMEGDLPNEKITP